MTETDQNIKDKQNKRLLIATSIASPLSSIIAKYNKNQDPSQSNLTSQDFRLQVWALSQAKYYRIYKVSQIYKNQGIKGFFPGVTIASFGSVLAFSAYLTAYQKTKMILSQYEFFNQYPSAMHLLSGFSAQFFSCVFWLPIDIIKERMQVQTQIKLYKYDSPTDAMKKIHKTEGLIGLYRAFGATLVFFGPMSAIFFASYEYLKKKIVKDTKNQTMVQSIICSAGAGAISGYLTTPLQMVKMRMQIQRADSAMKGIPLQKTLYGYKNIFHGIYLVFKNQGFIALFKGAGLRVLFTVPVNTVTFTLAEYFRKIALRSKIPDYFI